MKATDCILVLGDVRAHGVTCTLPQDFQRDPLKKVGDLGEEDTKLSRSFFGGAVILRLAVELSLAGSCQVLGYGQEELARRKKRLIDTLWKLDSVSPEGHEEETLRLFPLGAQEPRPPYKPQDLSDILFPIPDPIQEWSRRKESDEVHLLLIDDLSLCMSRLPVLDLANEDSKKRAEKIIGRMGLEVDQVEEIQKYCEQLGAIFHKLKDSCRTESAQPSSRPLVCVSVTGPIPDLAGAKREGNFWHELHSHSGLSRRTIVILDAADLRRAGVGISTSLSWERTAQDTVAQLNSHPQLRRFTRFRHLIIRYGATGALHCRFDQRTPQYTLYFDPAHEDATWLQPREGHILGYNDIYAGTLVQHMKRACDEYLGNSFLTDFDQIVGDAVKVGVERCQYLCAYGYGSKARDLTLSGGGDIFSFPLFPPQIFSEDTLEHPKNLRFGPLVAEAPVQVSYSDVWSILDESIKTANTVTKPADIASMIARFGLQSTVNQPPWRPRLFCRELGREFHRGLNEALRYDETDVNRILRGIQDAIIDSRQVFGRRQLKKRESLVNLQPDGAEVCLFQDDVWDQVRKHLQGLLEAIRILVQSQPALSGVSVESLLEPAMRQLVNEETKTSLEAISQLRTDFETFVAELRLKLEDDLEAKERFEVWAAPFARFGALPGGKKNRDRRMIFLDRQEIEGVRTIRNLIHRHFQAVIEKKSKRPLSLAVFGPPGSGKSSAVSSIIDTLKQRLETSHREAEMMSYNLAQYTESKRLDDAFGKITTQLAQGKVPIVFFDEFDCRFQNEELGWLKFFLAPMEDGKYNDQPVQDAIFVFAGGTSRNFAEFSQKDVIKTSDSYKRFSSAKGPDFTSRLDGHMNIMGINRISSLNYRDELYVVRRGLFLRNLFAEMQDLKNFEESRVDLDLLRALLLVPEYKHGGRSMRKVLQLCAGPDGRVEKSLLPTIDQLDMHVDGMAFMELIAGPPTSDGR